MRQSIIEQALQGALQCIPPIDREECLMFQELQGWPEGKTYNVNEQLTWKWTSKSPCRS